MKLALLAFCSLYAMAAMAPNTDGGAEATTAGAAEATTTDVVQADQTGSHPLTADQVKPAEPILDPAKRAVETSAKGEPPEAKETKAKHTHVVWAQPGHETYRPGDLLKVPTELAQNLRAAGRARFADPAEVKAADKDHIRAVDSV